MPTWHKDALVLLDQGRQNGEEQLACGDLVKLLAKQGFVVSSQHCAVDEVPEVAALWISLSKNAELLRHAPWHTAVLVVDGPLRNIAHAQKIAYAASLAFEAADQWREKYGQLSSPLLDLGGERSPDSPQRHLQDFFGPTIPV